MRFSILIPALAIAGSAAAVPPTKQDIIDAADIYYENAIAAGCDWLACVSSLAGETAACAAAAAEAGVNIIADIACLASVGSAGSACKNC
ncbi:hypothetical protein B0H63DRAFT_528813 [Podospora didyma]|uniref:Fungal calcium binding protein domain-containing protein n=1 Tax=Podospora didyma TaxID=330526 RepID=A0AAE0N3V2_9PEZI|nr:hypothetical protein B0H63DRAFT_528813 [Podospora didyma]